MKFIYAADLHLREDKPICRKDEDWIETQRLQLRFIKEQCNQNECDLIIGGDLCHRPSIPDYLKSVFIFELSDLHIYAIAGNHCLRYHSWANVDSSTFGVLLSSGIIKQPDFAGFANFGQATSEVKNEMVFIHEPIFATEKDCPPNMRAKTAVQVFDEYPKAKWIFCGDIHKGYVVNRQGRHLIMAGSMNRQVSNSIDYEPKIYFIDTDKDLIVPILMPDDVTMVSDLHIKDKKDRDDRISTFISSIKDSETVSLDFSDNVEKEILNTPELSKGTIDAIYELMNE